MAKPPDDVLKILDQLLQFFSRNIQLR